MNLKNEREKIQRLMYRMQLVKLREIDEFLVRNNIEPILIKGIAAAANYPEPHQRVFGDIDLAVDPDSYAAARKLVGNQQFAVDLHRGLRHLDTLVWEDLFRNSRKLNFEGFAVRVLRPEDHLRVMCVHWLNDGGADRSRLWDIYFALKRRPAQFDWERFLGTVSGNRRNWLLAVVSIVREYFGLEFESDCINNAGHMPLWIKKQIEREWRSDQRLIPLQRIMDDKRQFFGQIMKRFPPNALQALVENEGDIGLTPGHLRRAANIFRRTKPSLRRLLRIDPDI